jgi:hypothetical protein
MRSPRKIISFPDPELIERLQEWRKQESPNISESETIRRLIEFALDLQEKQRPH